MPVLARDLYWNILCASEVNRLCSRVKPLFSSQFVRQGAEQEHRTHDVFKRLTQLALFLWCQRRSAFDVCSMGRFWRASNCVVSQLLNIAVFTGNTIDSRVILRVASQASAVGGTRKQELDFP